MPTKDQLHSIGMYSKEEGSFHEHVGKRFSLTNGNKEVFAGVVESIVVRSYGNAEEVCITPVGGKFSISVAIYNDQKETSGALWKLCDIDNPFEPIHRNLRLNLKELERRQ